MKIAIFSDSHDNIPNIDKFFAWCNDHEIEQVICCGDLCTAETLEHIITLWDKPLHLVFGNVAEEQLLVSIADDYKHIIQHENQGEVMLGGLHSALVHYPQEAKQLAETGKYQYVFYGHTHKPWEEKIGECKVVNPGTLAGMFYKATFACLDLKNNNLQLHLVERLT